MDEIESRCRVWFRHWHDLVDPTGPEWEDEDSAGGMFNELWNDRERLAACLAPLPRAKALTSRINEIIDVALGGSSEPPGLYYQVSRPYPASDGELLEWTGRFYRRCRELTGMPDAIPPIEIVRCAHPIDAYLDSHRDTDSEPYDRLHDWLGDAIDQHCTTDETAAYHVLEEALYKMACDYKLADYVLWVLLEPKVEGPDPCRPQFDLWRSGAVERFRPGEGVTVFAPISTSRIA